MQKNKRKEEIIPLSKAQKENAKEKIKEYIEENFETEIGNLQAEVFLDYITEHMGIYYYNKAVADALSFMTERIDDMYLLMKDEE